MDPGFWVSIPPLPILLTSELRFFGSGAIFQVHTAHLVFISAIIGVYYPRRMCVSSLTRPGPSPSCFPTLPLHVFWRIQPAAFERNNVIDDVAWACS
jgi:hypothetical protein